MKSKNSIFRRTIISSVLLQLLSLSQVHADTTISVTDGATRTISGNFDSTGTTAISVDGQGSTVTGGEDVVVNTTNTSGIGLAVSDGGSAIFDGISISTGGGYSSGISNNSGIIDLKGGLISTLGEGSHGIYINGTDTKNTIDGVSISTSGNYSNGIYNQNGDIALKGGTISTSGRSSHGISAIEADTKTTIDGTAISVTGSNSYGVYIASDVELTMNNSSISSSGANGLSVFVSDGAKLIGSKNTFNINSVDGSAIYFLPAGYANLTDTTVNTISGNWIQAFRLSTDSELVMNGLEVKSKDSKIAAVFNLYNGGTLNLTDANIELGGGSLYSADSYTNDKANLLLTNVNAISSTQDSAALLDNGRSSSTTIIGGSFTNLGNGSGISIGNTESTLLAEGIQLTTQGIGVDNSDTAVINNSIITTNDINGTGILAGHAGITLKASNTHLTNVQLTTKGQDALGVNNTGTFVAEDSVITTLGDNAHGIYSHERLYVTPERSIASTPSDVTTTGTTIITKGAGSVGIKSDSSSTGYEYVRDNSINMTRTLIETAGNNSHGVWLVNGNNISLNESKLTTKGIGAYGIYALNSGAATNQVTLDGTVAISEQAAGLWASSANINLELKNGSELISGNGVLSHAEFNSNVNINGDNQSILNGDLQADQSSVINLSLANNSVWTGAAEKANDIDVDDSSVWNLTGDANIRAFNLGGNLNFTPGSSYRSSGTSFSTLTVNGDMAGNDGLMTMNVALGDDNSQGDKLVVLGNTSGNTGIKVINAGGIGGQTVEGIQVVSVAGQSDGNFSLQGRAVAGAYEYQLAKGGVSTPNDGAWYLRSDRLPDPIPDPIPAPIPDPTPTPDPVIDPTPSIPVTPSAPIIRPEAGSYLANIATASKLFNLRLEDREGRAENSSMWLRQQGSRTKFRDSSGQLKIATNTYVIQGGGEVAQTQFTDSDRLGIGLMLGYGKSDSESGNSYSGYNSKGTVDGYSGGVYATWYQDAKTLNGAYVDSWVQYSMLNAEVSGEQLSSEGYDMNGLSASVESGYRIPVYQGKNGHVFVTPQAQVTWNGIKADDHTEDNGTRVKSDGNNNVQTRLGVKLSRDGVSDMDNGSDKLFTTYVEANWLHNTEQAVATMDGVSIKQAGNTNVGELKVGAEGQLNKHVNLWTNVAQQVGGNGYSDTALTVGFKYKF